MDDDRQLAELHLQQRWEQERKDKAELYAALAKAQASFGKALKQSNNPHFKSKYADLASVSDAVTDALNSNDIFLTQDVISAGSGEEAGVTVTTIFCHKSGARLEMCPIFMPCRKIDAQAYGSALTYARRYSLMAACGIAPEDDDGNAAVAGGQNIDSGRAKQKPVDDALKMTGSQAKEILALAQKAGASISKILTHYRVGHLSELNADMYDVITAQLNKKMTQKGSE
jgi:hypothetical protein